MEGIDNVFLALFIENRDALKNPATYIAGQTEVATNEIIEPEDIKYPKTEE